jgi:predicted Zn-dependent peptidase
VQPALSQIPKEPEREQLLNGLRVLVWSQPGSPELLVKLRINSGAAFDLAGKSGQMAVLGDLLFPDAATVDFFTEELGGKLEVSVNYDSVTITMVGKAAEFEQVISVLRNGLLSTQFTPEVVTRIRDARIKTLRDATISSSLVADRAIAARLFDDFPYGRLSGGTPEDLARVQRADLMQAHDRFFNSNNATLAIVGGVTKARAIRTVRQLLGPWRKSENIVPTTFTQPKAADAHTLIVNVPGPTSEIRLAVRGLRRSDSDFVASTVMARLAQQRWQAMAPELAKQPVFARSNGHVLPGSVVMGAAVGAEKTADALASARKVIESLITTPATPAELERAKSEVVNEAVSAATKPEATPDPWLDADTYRFDAIQDQAALLRAVTAADIQRVATRLYKDAPIASVVTGEAAQLKATLQGRVQYEVLGETPVPAPAPKPPTKPRSNANPR